VWDQRASRFLLLGARITAVCAETLGIEIKMVERLVGNWQYYRDGGTGGAQLASNSLSANDHKAANHSPFLILESKVGSAIFCRIWSKPC